MSNEWYESLRAMGDAELPFKADGEENSNLQVLHLSEKSTAEDVRRVAVSTRRKFEEGGINAETFKALRWALEKTRDARTDQEFLSFMLDPRVEFGHLEANRMDFR